VVTLKILIVNTRHYFGGGDSTYTFNLSQLLRKKGNDVAFFAMQSEVNLPDDNSDLFVPFIDFKELNQDKNVLNGLNVLSRSIYSRDARNRFARLLDRIHPDIVHLQNLHAHITPSVIFEAKARNIPVIWTLHDYKVICPNSHFRIDKTGEICEACGKSTYYQPILKRCKKDSLLASMMASLEASAHLLIGVKNKVDYFCAPSAFLRSKFLERGYDGKKIIHTPLFLPDDMFVASQDAGEYILFFGKLDPVKGIYILLEAIRKVPHVKLILAGGIDEAIKTKLLQMLPQNAKYVGMKFGDELWKLVQGALAIVLPSIWYENQPFSILEAFANRKPVITSKLGGMAELVADQERGLLVPPGNVDALADAMEWMQNNRQDAIRMGETAYSYAVEQHGEKLHYQRIMAIYEQVLK